MRFADRTPRPGRVDVVQWKVLCQVNLRDLLRGGADATTGARGNPLLQITISMGFLGGLFALNVARFPGPSDFLVALFAFVTFTVAIAILPDTFDVRERKLEILRSKPVTGETFMAARATALLAIATLMVLCLGGPGLLAAAARYSLGPLTLLRLSGALVASAFAGVLSWLAVALFLALRLGVERLRMVTQLVLVSATLVVSLVSLGAGPLGFLPESALPPLAAHPIARLLPSSWFLALAMPRAGWEAPLALSVLCAALVVTVRLDGDRLYSRYAENLGRDAHVAGPGLATRLLSAFARLPLVGRVALPGPARAVALIVLAVSEREETSRLKSLAPRLLQLVFFGFALAEPHGLMPVALVAITGFFGLLDGVTAVGQGAIPAAAWVFRGSPVGVYPLLHGLRSAVYTRYFLLAVVLVSIVLFRGFPPLAALVLLAAYHLHAGLLVSAVLILRPSLPLSRDLTSAPGLAGALGSHVLAVVAGFSFVIACTLVNLLGTPGLIVVLVLLGPALAVSIGLRLLAARRIEALEYTG